MSPGAHHRIGGWLAVTLVAGCAATEGPLWSEPAAFQDAATQASPRSGVAGPIRGDMRLQYQLVGALELDADAELFVIDLFENMADDVAALHSRGRVVVAYVAAGSHEPFRPDADAFPAAALGAPLPDYPEESWLDVRDPTVRDLMAQRIALAAGRGFDGVLFSSLDAYRHDSGFALGAADQLDYNGWLAGTAQAEGLRAGLSGDFAQAVELASRYDFAIHTGCVAAARCAEVLPFAALGKPAFDLETTGDAAQVCAEAARLELSVTLKRDGFDAWFQSCP